MNKFRQNALKLINAGIEERIEANERRRIQIVNVIGLFSSLSAFPFAVLFFSTGANILGSTSVFSILLYSYVILLNRQKKYLIARFIVVEISIFLVFLGCIILPEGVWLHALFFLTICHPWLLYNILQGKATILPFGSRSSGILNFFSHFEHSRIISHHNLSEIEI